jgi:hypothetical protein
MFKMSSLQSLDEQIQELDQLESRVRRSLAMIRDFEAILLRQNLDSRLEAWLTVLETLLSEKSLIKAKEDLKKRGNDPK